ncbi:MAG: ABC-2 family transporter protein [Anaerolineales bacterium]|nr:ABC-2 family transporter protein [Anaerolineales bacterium]
MQYRSAFLMDILATAIVTASGFGTLALVFKRFGSIAGWRLGEIAFLYGMVEASFGWMDLVFGGFDPQNFGRQVRLGRLDQLLLRPASITLQVLGSEFVMRRWGRILQGTAILVLATYMADIQWTALKALLLPVVLVSLFFFFAGLFIIGATITFWTVESIEVINIFTYGGSEMMAYPMSIYPAWMRHFFTYILPAIFLNYYPALYILGKPDPLGMPAFAPLLSPLVGVGILLIGLGFWRFGLRHYQSTGT